MNSVLVSLEADEPEKTAGYCLGTNQSFPPLPVTASRFEERGLEFFMNSD